MVHCLIPNIGGLFMYRMIYIGSSSHKICRLLIGDGYTVGYDDLQLILKQKSNINMVILNDKANSYSYKEVTCT